MKCPYCGYENPEGAQFCGNDGSPLPVKPKRKIPCSLIALIIILSIVLLFAASLLIDIAWLSDLVHRISLSDSMPTQENPVELITPQKTIDGQAITDIEIETQVPLMQPGEDKSNKILFVSDRDGDEEIFIMDEDGNNQIQLTFNQLDDWDPEWSPDGDQIAFISYVNGNDEIFVMNSDGSNLVQLTTNNNEDGYIEWSPNGDKIVFHSLRDGNWDIHLMEADGSDQKQLTFSQGDDKDPDWSPAGDQITFWSDRNGVGEVFIMNADGTNQKQLTLDCGYGGFPQWSPDGEWIVYMSNYGGDTEIFTIDINGNNEKQFTHNNDDDFDPSWSPDGTQIVYVSDVKSDNYDIHVIDTVSGNITPLTHGVGFDFDTSWSPDGKQIAFVSTGNLNKEINVMSIDGTYFNQLTSNTYDDHSPAWSSAVITASPSNITEQTSPTTAAPTTAVSQGVGSSMVSEKDGMRSMYVPEGEFIMGTEGSYYNDVLAHEVYLDAFWIDQTEVTVGMFVKFVDETGYITEAELRDESWIYKSRKKGDPVSVAIRDDPVVNISWFEANQYCAWAGRRLPTEAEWEKAARGTDMRKYPWGDTFYGDRLNYCDRSCIKERLFLPEWDDGYSKTAPVGSFLSGASPYGALDMAGNVYEWVSDWYDMEYYDISPYRNPKGPDEGTDRVRRGGSYYGTKENARMWYRSYGSPRSGGDSTGFRCASSPWIEIILR